MYTGYITFRFFNQEIGSQSEELAELKGARRKLSVLNSRLGLCPECCSLVGSWQTPLERLSEGVVSSTSCVLKTSERQNSDLETLTESTRGALYFFLAEGAGEAYFLFLNI